LDHVSWAVHDYSRGGGAQKHSDPDSVIRDVTSGRIELEA